MKSNYQLIEEKLNKANKELQYGTYETKQSNADMKAIMEAHAHRAEVIYIYIYDHIIHYILY